MHPLQLNLTHRHPNRTAGSRAIALCVRYQDLLAHFLELLHPMQPPLPRPAAPMVVLVTQVVISTAPQHTPSTRHHLPVHTTPRRVTTSTHQWFRRAPLYPNGGTKRSPVEAAVPVEEGVAAAEVLAPMGRIENSSTLCGTPTALLLLLLLKTTSTTCMSMQNLLSRRRGCSCRAAVLGSGLVMSVMDLTIWDAC